MSTHLHPLIKDSDEYEKTILHAPEIPPFRVYNPHKKSCWAKSGEHGIKLSLEDTDKVFYFREAEAKGIHRWQTSKAAMRAAATIADAGVSAAKAATNPTMVSLGLGAAAAPAAGIGLMIAGIPIMVGSFAVNMRAAYKTSQHKTNLQKLDQREAPFPCKGMEWFAGFPLGARISEHNTIKAHVLPYIIRQKNLKEERSFRKAVPVLGALTKALEISRHYYKKRAGTLGVDRKNAASWLGIHLITHNCALAQAIVAELYSLDEMLYLQTLEFSEVVGYLMEKMKSK